MFEEYDPTSQLLQKGAFSAFWGAAALTGMMNAVFYCVADKKETNCNVIVVLC